MNDVIQNIKSRRSVRKYTSKQVSDELIEQIIQAGTYAPSAHNQQPWHFTIVQNKELINHISKISKEEMAKSDSDWYSKKGNDESFNLFYGAPTIIIISGKEKAFSSLTDCSAAIQNMMLAANSLGLATCWIGLIKFFFNVEDEVKKLNLPEGFIPYYAICLGYEDDDSKTIKPERNVDVFEYIR